MPFDSDIYFNDFLLQFFLLNLRGSVYFHLRNCAGLNWNFAFSSVVSLSLNEDKLKSQRTVRFG